MPQANLSSSLCTFCKDIVKLVVAEIVTTLAGLSSWNPGLKTITEFLTSTARLFPSQMLQVFNSKVYRAKSDPAIDIESNASG